VLLGASFPTSPETAINFIVGQMPSIHKPAMLALFSNLQRHMLLKITAAYMTCI